MVVLVRVDDRLLHGQIICAWVPFSRADALVVASDEAAKDSLVSEIIASCGHTGLEVYVKTVDEAASYVAGSDGGARIILIIADLRDAMRVYEDGLKFTSLNLGNIHHDDGGHVITPSVIVNGDDEEIIERFEKLGVAIDIRDIPASRPAPYWQGGVAKNRGPGEAGRR